MRILFLDDMKSRRDVFRQNSIGLVVDFATTAQEAIAFFRANKYDVIYLDHDLADEHYHSNEDHHEDGRFVARHLNEMTEQHGAIVLVHSLNPDGRLAIRSILNANFDVWLPENIKVSELWKVEAKILIGAIQKYNEAPKE